MKVFRQKKWLKGWIIGSFRPTMYDTKEFEVCYRVHPAREIIDRHYHKIATEYNYLIKGKMKILGKTIYGGDSFIINPFEIADPIFIETCEIIVVKVPSVKGDKYIIK